MNLGCSPFDQKASSQIPLSAGCGVQDSTGGKCQDDEYATSFGATSTFNGIGNSSSKMQQDTFKSESKLQKLFSSVSIQEPSQLPKEQSEKQGSNTRSEEEIEQTTAAATECDKCAICWKVAKKGSKNENIAILDGCNHRYCPECISVWAQKRNTCPQCKVRFYKIEIRDQEGKTTKEESIYDNTCKKCDKEHSICENKFYCQCCVNVISDERMVPSVCADCAHEYRTSNSLPFYFCDSCLGTLQTRHGAETFSARVNEFCSGATRLSEENSEYDIKIGVLNNLVKEIKTKLQNLLDSELADQSPVTGELVSLLEDKLNELVALKEKSEEVKNTMDKTLQEYEAFICVEQSQ